jgi:hypothetical protein
MFMGETPKIIVVGGGNLPLWKKLIAGMLYTIMLYYLYEDFMYLWNYPGFEMFLNVLALMLYHVGFILPITLFFSVVVTKQLDLGQQKLITLYSIGRFSKTEYAEIPNLEYVSVYLKTPGTAYEVNIWYQHKGHRRFNLGYFDTKSDAMEQSKLLAKVLSLDLLDATVKGNSVWVKE